jgi:hypothetical protein
MVKNDYSRSKNKKEHKKIIISREKTRIKKEIKRLQGENKKVFASKIKESCDIEVFLLEKNINKNKCNSPDNR